MIDAKETPPHIVATQLKIAQEMLQEIAGMKGKTFMADCCKEHTCKAHFDGKEKVAHCAFQYGVHLGLGRGANDAEYALGRIKRLQEDPACR